MSERLQEFVSAGPGLRVDDAQGIIHDARLLGRFSKNGREYTMGCITKAAPLYENAPVNVDHEEGRRGPRSYRDRLGIVRKVRVDEGGLRGDLHINMGHPVAKQLLWDARHAPEACGLSHVVEGEVTRRNGKVLVESITKVFSLDVVSDPATSHGLHESTDPAAGKRALVESVATEIALPLCAALACLDGGLATRETREEITAYLTGIKEHLVQSGHLSTGTPKLAAGDIAALRLDRDPQGAAELVARLTGRGECASDTPVAESAAEFARVLHGLPAHRNGFAKSLKS